jgi:hypothetical protein
MSVHSLIILALATWRLTSLLVNEDGPFKMFYRLREWAGVIHNGNGDVIGCENSLFAGLLSCFWCTSVWIAIILSALFSDWLLWFPLALFASAGAIIVEEGMQWLGQQQHSQI